MMSDNAIYHPKSLEMLSHLEKNVDNNFSQRLEHPNAWMLERGRGSN